MSDMVLSDATADRLLEAWERHDEFGPAFVEVYEAITGAVDRLADVLRNGATANSVWAQVEVVQNAVGPNRHQERANAIVALRIAGLSLRVIASLTQLSIEECVGAAHNLAVSNGSESTYQLLDEMLCKGTFTPREMADATGVPIQSVRRIASRIGREVEDGRQRTTTPEALLHLRTLHFVCGMPKGAAVREAQKDYPCITKSSGFAALRTDNGVLDTLRCAS